VSVGLVGRTYLERGGRVRIVAQWRRGPGEKSKGPRNVLIRRTDGTLVVRPFRGLRKAAEDI
jgi:acetyl esterase